MGMHNYGKSLHRIVRDSTDTGNLPLVLQLIATARMSVEGYGRVSRKNTYTGELTRLFEMVKRMR